MSKSGYQYAPDEFDQPAPHGAPAGVHRTQRSGWRKTWPFLLVMVIFAGLALGGFYFWLNRPASTPSASQPSSSAPVDPGTADAGAGETPQESESAAPSPAETPEPVPSASEGAGTVNKAATIRVLNGAGIQGLAAKGADVLKAAGYTAVTADDYKKNDLTVNTVYYKTPEMEATALDVATQLGIPAENVKLVPANQADVSVILMKSFTS